MIKDYIVATSTEQVIECLNNSDFKYQVISGGTDLMVDLKVGKKSNDRFIDVTNVSEFQGISETEEEIVVGAAVTFQEIVESELIAEKLPALAEACSYVGSWQIRNRGTLAGNIVHAQPAADGALMLNALDARVRVINDEKSQIYRVMDLYEGAGKSKLDSTNQVIEKIMVPKPGEKQGMSFQRIAKRNSLALPMINVATVINFDEQESIEQARIVAAPVAPIPKRLTAVEDKLKGSNGDDQAINNAISEVAKEVSPRDSLLRGSSDYRTDLVTELVQRGIQEAVAEAKA